MLKSYRIKERKEANPKLPKNPHLAKDFYEHQLKKFSAAPKFKEFKLYNQ